jgi:hypothetical protein
MNLAPINVAFKPSRRLATVLLAAHIASAILILVLPLPLWSKFVALPIITASAWHNVRAYALFATPTAVRSLRILSNGNLEIDRGKWQSATLVGEQFIHPQLTIIRCKTETSRRAIAIVILPDMLDSEAFRALRVRLKWRA